MGDFTGSAFIRFSIHEESLQLNPLISVVTDAVPGLYSAVKA